MLYMQSNDSGAQMKDAEYKEARNNSVHQHSVLNTRSTWSHVAIICNWNEQGRLWFNMFLKLFFLTCLGDILQRMDIWEMIRQREILLNAINSLGCVSLALERILVSVRGQVQEQGSGSLSRWIKDTVPWEGGEVISVPSSAGSAEHRARAAFWTEAFPPAELNIRERESLAFLPQSLKQQAATQTLSHNSRNGGLLPLLDTLGHPFNHNLPYLFFAVLWDGRSRCIC